MSLLKKDKLDYTELKIYLSEYRIKVTSKTSHRMMKDLSISIPGIDTYPEQVNHSYKSLRKNRINLLNNLRCISDI